MLRLIFTLAAVLIVAASLASRLSEVSAQALQSHIYVKGKKQGAFKGGTQGSSSSKVTSDVAIKKPAAPSSRRR